MQGHRVIRRGTHDRDEHEAIHAGSHRGRDQVSIAVSVDSGRTGRRRPGEAVHRRDDVAAPIERSVERTAADVADHDVDPGRQVHSAAGVAGDDPDLLAGVDEQLHHPAPEQAGAARHQDHGAEPAVGGAVNVRCTAVSTVPDRLSTGSR